jgi:hypothetical protein
MPGETVQLTHAAFGLTAQTMRVIEVLIRIETVEVSQGKHVLVPMIDLSARGRAELALYVERDRGRDRGAAGDPAARRAAAGVRR